LNDGVANTLLVYWHGVQQEADTAISIRLNGRYIGGAHEGTESPSIVFRFTCPEDRWVMSDTTTAQKA
jgi:hypothetical protein